MNCTIQEIDSDLNLQINEFDGKVVYGEKKSGSGYVYEGHASQLSHLVSDLSKLESMAQNNYLKISSLKKLKTK